MCFNRASRIRAPSRSSARAKSIIEKEARQRLGLVVDFVRRLCHMRTTVMEQWHKQHPIIDFWAKGARTQKEGVVTCWLPSTGPCSRTPLSHSGSLKSKDHLLAVPATLGSTKFKDNQALKAMREGPTRCLSRSRTSGTATRERSFSGVPPILSQWLHNQRLVSKQVFQASRRQPRLLRKNIQ